MKLLIFACALIVCVAGAAVEKKCTDAQWTEYVAWRVSFHF